jgi:hypothetical protein
MKLRISITALSMLFLFSCNKKDTDCSAIANKAPCYVAFKGFNTSDLNIVVQYRYAQGSSFGTRLSTDTFRYPGAVEINSIIYATAGKMHMGNIFYDADYELVIPAVSRTFRITDLTYTTDTVVKWTSDHGCGSFGTFVVHPETINVDNTTKSTADLTGAGKWIVLEK